MSGQITDPQSKPVADLRVRLITPNRQGASREQTTDKNGHFEFHVALLGTYTLKVSAPGFQELTKSIFVSSEDSVGADVQLGSLTARQESITVTADVKEANILFPDPAQRVFVHQDTLDANPGRPGAPISILAYPLKQRLAGSKPRSTFRQVSPEITGSPSPNTSK